MKCHLQFTSTVSRGGSTAPPGCTGSHGVEGGGAVCYFGEGFGEGEKHTKALTPHCPPRELCLPWELQAGEVAQPPLLAEGTRGEGVRDGVSRDLAEQHDFALRSSPRNTPRFYFPPPLITYLHLSHCPWAASRVSPTSPHPSKAQRSILDSHVHPFRHYLSPHPSSTPSQFPRDPPQP